MTCLRALRAFNGCPVGEMNIGRQRQKRAVRADKGSPPGVHIPLRRSPGWPTRTSGNTAGKQKERKNTNMATGTEPASDPFDTMKDVVLEAIHARAERVDAAHNLPRGTAYRLMSCGRELHDDDVEVLAFVLDDLRQYCNCIQVAAA